MCLVWRTCSILLTKPRQTVVNKIENSFLAKWMLYIKYCPDGVLNYMQCWMFWNRSDVNQFTRRKEILKTIHKDSQAMCFLSKLDCLLMHTPFSCQYSADSVLCSNGLDCCIQWAICTLDWTLVCRAVTCRRLKQTSSDFSKHRNAGNYCNGQRSFVCLKNSIVFWG